MRLPSPSRPLLCNARVYSATTPESNHKAILSVTIINRDIDTITHLIRDARQCNLWVHRCKDSKVHRKINDKEDYIYTTINMPFPVKDRDILAHVKWQKDPETQVITSIGTATVGIVDQQKQKIRIEEAQMIWELTPLTNGYTQIRNFAHINPAGNIPLWITHSFATEAPFQTMLGLRAILQLGLGKDK